MQGFLSVLMHDLRNSLSAIQVLTQLGTKRSGEAEQRDCFRQIDEQVRVVFGLLKALREGLAVEDFTDVSPAEIVRQAADEILPAARSRGIRLEWSRKGDCRLALKANLFRRALLALLRSVIASMAEGGRLEVTVVCRKDEAEISIADTGPGIPAELREDFFKPLYRPSDGENGQEVYLAYQIITRLHRGELRLDTQAGRGTIFQIRLQGS